MGAKMKIRNGFVSNSSSSCFIIAYDPKVFDLSKEKRVGKARATIGIQKVFEFYKNEYRIDDDWADDEAEQHKNNFATFAAKFAKSRIS